MSKTTATATSLNQQIMAFGFNVPQAKEIVSAATARGTIANLRTIAGSYERLTVDQRAKAKDMLAQLLPAVEPDLDAMLGGLLGGDDLPAVPTSQPATSKSKATKAKEPASQPARERTQYTGQIPVAICSGRRLPWLIGANTAKKTGVTYVNLGDGYRQQLGMSVAEWREVLTTRRDELLAAIVEIAAQHEAQ